MKVHVGNFWSKPPNGCKKVSIARSTPPGQDCLLAWELAPSYPLLKGYKDGTITWAEYEARYYEEIASNLEDNGHPSAFISHQVTKYLEQIKVRYGFEEIMLCCWERRKSVEEREIKPCHRDLIYAMLPDDVKGESLD